MTPARAVDLLIAAGIPTKIRWATGNFGSLATDQGLLVAIDDGIPGIPRSSAMAFGDGVAGIQGTIRSPHVQAVRAALGLEVL